MSKRRADAPPRSMRDQYSFIARRLADFGYSIKPGSRLDLGHSVFATPDGAPRTIFRGDPDYPTAFEAKLDFQLFEFILENVALFEHDEIAVRKLKDALRDGVAPGGAENTRGRDTQFEVYVAVALNNAGLAPRFLDVTDQPIPDLRAIVAGSYFFVEAKRPKSVEAIIERLDEGIWQLQATGCPGAVFVDISLARNRERTLRELKTSEAAFRAEHAAEVKTLIHSIEDRLHDMLKATRTVGVYFQDHVVWRLGESETRVESMAMCFPNRSSGARYRTAWSSFVRATDRGWGAWQHHTLRAR